MHTIALQAVALLAMVTGAAASFTVQVTLGCTGTNPSSVVVIPEATYESGTCQVATVAALVAGTLGRSTVSVRGVCSNQILNTTMYATSDDCSGVGTVFEVPAESICKDEHNGVAFQLPSPPLTLGITASCASDNNGGSNGSNGNTGGHAVPSVALFMLLGAAGFVLSAAWN